MKAEVAKVAPAESAEVRLQFQKKDMVRAGPPPSSKGGLKGASGGA